MIKDMEEVMRDIPMQTYTKENLSLGKHTAKDDIPGIKVEKFMMENGRKECGTAMEYGRE